LVAVIAGVHAILNHTIAADRYLTSIQTVIGIDLITIITGIYAFLHHAISANRNLACV
jgi:hypothetical protein